MTKIKVTGDISIVLIPLLNEYDPSLPLTDPYAQLALWGGTPYVIQQ
tara:strand:+ start:608 stop:748 length:141 start_codon:yes stop_codon:yes gene_type:complete